MFDDGRVLLIAGLAALVAVKRFAPGSGSRCACGGSANGSRSCGCGSFAKASDAEEVISAWSRSRPGVTETAHLKTDGSTLWSYQTVIGETWTDGGKIVYDLKRSATTSKHTNKAKKVADHVLGSVEETEPVRGIGGMRPPPYGERVPRPKTRDELANEPSKQEEDWAERGPWTVESEWDGREYVVRVENKATGKSKKMGTYRQPFSREKAIREAAKRNRAEAGDA
jgi:hypothetical protein